MPIAPEYLHLVHQGPFPCFLYGRNSRDPKKKGRSVDDQLHEGRRLASVHNWPVVHEYKDTGVSASRHARKKRDDFESMLEGIRTRQVRLVVAFEASRYYRDLSAYVALRQACLESETLLCYDGMVYDLSRREDRKATARDAVDAEDEAEAIRERNLRTTRLNAEKGGPHGHVPEGYKRRYDPDTGELIDQVPHPERSKLIEDIFDRVAAGESIRSICMELNRRGVLTQRGRPWEDWHFRDLLRNPIYIGHRIFQGRDIGRGAWPALVDDKVFYAVQAILDAPGRSMTPGPAIRHLQTHIAMCGEHPDEPPLKQTKNGGKPSLVCSTRFDVTVNERMADAYVEEAVVTWLSSPAAEAAFRPDNADKKLIKARLLLEQLENQLDEARRAAARIGSDGRPELSVGSLAALEAALTPQIAAARMEAQPQGLRLVLLEIAGNACAQQVWEALDVGQRRLLLRRVATVRLFKAGRRGVRGIEAGRIRIAFPGERDFKGGWRRVPAPPPAAGAPSPAEPETR